jgi:hypothetical protein
LEAALTVAAWRPLSDGRSVNTLQHLSEDILEGYLLRTLTPAEVERLEEHLIGLPKLPGSAAIYG